ncbi:hypothetical protein HU200_027912 [Digitaria exilis]|uniref:Uncharacterized protein n=1 Tax=Digitaria exilis TaxID=1010633 RepID=A0A835C6H1_9POAL|nr:hypothetical protein HU200_027912 [Digitaria exilis]
MATYSFILANMSNKGALADLSWSNNWQDFQVLIPVGLRVQQKVDDKLCFHLVAKHAVGQLKMHAVRMAVHTRVTSEEEHKLIRIKDHRVQTVKCQFFEILSTSIGEMLCRIYFGQRRRATHSLISGTCLVMTLISEGFENIMAPVHCISQHVQLEEHSLVCDLPSHCLVDDDLCSKQNYVEPILNIQWCRLREFADEEIYGSCGQLTQNCRNENIHSVSLSYG